MELPNNINVNTYLAYYTSSEIETLRKIKAENFCWNSRIPKSLVVLSIEKLGEIWMGSPKLRELPLKDQESLLHVLNINVPLQMLVDNIKSDIFWKRCYKAKWSDTPLIPEEKKWINLFMERHFSEIIENMNPSSYDPEKVSLLVKLCGPYIETLSIRSLMPTDLPVERITSPEMIDLVTSQKQINQVIENANNKQNFNRDHISLHAALGSLANLVELHLTYQLKYAGVMYRKDQFQFTNEDAKNLARGLEKCTQLKILRITRSNISFQRIKYILCGLSDNDKLETLDLSHCKLNDDSLICLAKFLIKHEHIKNLVLVDNLFGPLGAESLSHALNQSNCGVRFLDLRLNNNLGSEGVAYIAVALARGCNLTALNISGSGIKPGPLPKPPAGVWSALRAESPPTCGELLARAIGLAKTPLRSLDISVNDIGSPSDQALSNAICLSHIIDLNLRKSGMSSMAVSIGEAAAAAQRLRRDAEKGIRFRRSASRVLQARRVARGMNINADPIRLAQQLSARPSIVSVASEEGVYNIQTQPLPSDFGFIPTFKSPLPSSRSSSITGPPTSRRSSHHTFLETVQEVRRSTLVRRGSDGSLLQSRNNTQRHIKILVSNDDLMKS